jgi:hypothetical protein
MLVLAKQFRPLLHTTAIFWGGKNFAHKFSRELKSRDNGPHNLQRRALALRIS